MPLRAVSEVWPHVGCPAGATWLPQRDVKAVGQFSNPSDMTVA